MQTDFERLLAIQEAQLSHARWAAGLQRSPFSPPELDAGKAAQEAELAALAGQSANQGVPEACAYRLPDSQQ